MRAPLMERTKPELLQLKIEFNFVKGNVVHWTPNGLSYPLWVRLPDNHKKQYGVSIDDPDYASLKNEQPL